MIVTSYTSMYFEEVIAIARQIDQLQVDKMVEILANLRRTGGRLFFL